MAKTKKIGLPLTFGIIIALLGLLAWFSSVIFEGEKPQVRLGPLPQYLSGETAFKLSASDMKRGLRSLRVTIVQGGRSKDILEKRFPFKGLLNSQGIRRYETRFYVDPSRLNLAQGRVDLQVRVWDYSRRGGGDGNQTLLQHKMLLDTIPPGMRALSRMNYVNVGGTGLLVYQASSDTVESGVFVNELFFKGYPVGTSSRGGVHVCYFAVPYNAGVHPNLYLWAKDRAGNVSKERFPHHIRRKKFRTESIQITDRFLKQVLPYFSFYPFEPEDSDIQKFLEINGKLREENGRVFFDLRTETLPEPLWEGSWLRLRNAATMARFADHRRYYYKGEQVDEKVHMGVDLASLANSEVPAANSGRVIYRDRLGIYGNTVVLDHGQGIASVYAHLSDFSVDMGQEVAKGDVIGHTGQTGLAGGDHLHFGIMVGGVFVNPVEWWDSHWLRDNILRKLALLKP